MTKSSPAPDSAAKKAFRILISNDDGINAPGLKALERIARTISDDIWVVAPETEQSGASHSLTLTQPLRIRKIRPRKFAVQGTPTDSVMLAVNHIIQGKLPDLLLSGVNRGANLGEDVTYSGTIAAAMEGTLLGIPSISLSQAVHREDRSVKWRTAEHFAPGLIADLLNQTWPKDVWININFPNVAVREVKGIAVTVQGRRSVADLIVDERIDARGQQYFWFGLRRAYGSPGHETDLKAVMERYISVTPLHLDLTHAGTRGALRDSLEQDFTERAR